MYPWQTDRKESAAIVGTVDKIDAETLNQLACEEIDKKKNLTSML